MSSMGVERETNDSIADMAGPAALPRRNGEMVFHDEWERRVFAMAVALCEAGHYGWDDFRGYLIEAIDAAGETPGHPRPEAPGYFEHWLASFERLLAEKGLAPMGPPWAPPS